MGLEVLDGRREPRPLYGSRGGDQVSERSIEGGIKIILTLKTWKNVLLDPIFILKLMNCLLALDRVFEIFTTFRLLN